MRSKKISDIYKESKVANICVNSKEYNALKKKWKDIPTTWNIVEKEIDKWVKHYSLFPFEENKEPCRERTITIQKTKDSITLINEDVLSEEKIEEEVEELDVYDYKEMLSYEPEPQSWLIENQIPKGEVGLEVGKRGERKTFTALHQALCLAAGKKVFGVDTVPEKKKVLFIDDETGKNEIVKRVKSLSKTMKIKEDIDFKCVSFSGLKLDRKDKKFDKFKELVEEFKPDLIIVDSLQRSVTFEVDKDNASISELFTDVVRPIIKKYGCSWLFIHHLRKSPPMRYKPEDLLDEVRGGSELVNYCRYILLCQIAHNQTTEGNTELVVFKTLKMSNAPIPKPKVISFTSNDNSLIVAYEGEPEEVLAAEVRAANRIKEWLFEKQMTKFRTKDVKDAQEEIGFKRTLLDQGLKVLKEQNFLSKPKHGHWEIVGDIQQSKLNKEVI